MIRRISLVVIMVVFVSMLGLVGCDYVDKDLMDKASSLESSNQKLEEEKSALSEEYAQILAEALEKLESLNDQMNQLKEINEGLTEQNQSIKEERNKVYLIVLGLYRERAKEELDACAHSSHYLNDTWNEVTRILKAGHEQMDKAQTTEEIDEILEESKKLVNQVERDGFGWGHCGGTES